MIKIKNKFMYWLNILLTAVALILECMPKSVEFRIRVSSGYIYKYGPFFYDFSSGFYIGIITILCLIFGVIYLIKTKRSIKITNIVLTTLGFAICIVQITTMKVCTTVYEILVAIIFFINAFINFATYEKENKVIDKKAFILNLITMLFVGVALILELIPWSLIIVQKFNFSASVTIVDVENPYFHYHENWVSFFGFIVAALTFCILLITLITLYKNKKGLRITQVVMSTVCALCSIIILIMAGNSLTPYNVIITLLFIAPIVAQSIMLKDHCKTAENKNQVKGVGFIEKR